MSFTGFFNFSPSTSISTSIEAKNPIAAKRNPPLLRNGIIATSDLRDLEAQGDEIDFISGALSFLVAKTMPRDNPPLQHYFSIETQLCHVPFHEDCGPLNLAHLYRFCQLMKRKIKSYPKCKITLVSSLLPDKRSNAAWLICGYMVLVYNRSPEEAWQPLATLSVYQPFLTFRDAGYGPATFHLTILDCLKALHKGVVVHRFVNMNTFNADEFEFYEKVENGDFNWIIPNFFLALATPSDQPSSDILRYHQRQQSNAFTPAQKTPALPLKPLCHLDDLCQYFNFPQSNVTALIRLNNKLYDRKRVQSYGIDHFELFFPDGSIPSFELIVKRFLALADSRLPLSIHHIPSVVSEPSSRSGAIAIHCKAGLGRTGTLICCWIMKTLEWTARDAIAWCRLMRPGSVVGPQQNWLDSMENSLWEFGRAQKIHHEKELLRMNHKLSSRESLKAAHYHRTLSVQAPSHLIVDSSGMDINDGHERLASSAMGISVPIQPSKQKPAEASNEAISANNLRYNLRSIPKYHAVDSSP